MLKKSPYLPQAFWGSKKPFWQPHEFYYWSKRNTKMQKKHTCSHATLLIFSGDDSWVKRVDSCLVSKIVLDGRLYCLLPKMSKTFNRISALVRTIPNLGLCISNWPPNTSPTTPNFTLINLTENWFNVHDITVFQV